MPIQGRSVKASMQQLHSIAMRLIFFPLLATGIFAQINKPPEFSQPGGFKKSEVSTAIDSAAHTSGQKSESAKSMASWLRAWLSEPSTSAVEQKIFESANRQFENGSLEDAARLFEQGLRTVPTSLRLAVGSTTALYAQGKYEESATTLLAVAKRYAKEGRLIPYFLELIDPALPSYPAVSRQLAMFAAELPKSGEAQFGWALCLLKKEGEASQIQAESVLRNAARLSPADPRPRFELGRLYESGERNAAAIREFLEVLKLDASQAQAHYRLSQLYLRTNEQEKATLHLERYQALKKR